jgi:hypothetical protein
MMRGFGKESQMHRRLLLGIAATIAASAMLTDGALASGPAPPGKEVIELTCEGIGPVTVSVPRSEHSEGAGQIVGEKGHGIAVALTFTLTDLRTGDVLNSESTARGGGHGHPHQATTTCSGVVFEAPASAFFGEHPLPSGVEPTDIIQGSFTGQIIVKR